jgi:hypothetical protein
MFLDSTSMSWPIKLLLSLLVFGGLIYLFGDYF